MSEREEKNKYDSRLAWLKRKKEHFPYNFCVLFFFLVSMSSNINNISKSLFKTRLLHACRVKIVNFVKQGCSYVGTPSRDHGYSRALDREMARCRTHSLKATYVEAAIRIDVCLKLFMYLLLCGATGECF